MAPCLSESEQVKSFTALISVSVSVTCLIWCIVSPWGSPLWEVASPSCCICCLLWRRVEKKPRRAGSEAAWTDVPQAAAGGVHQGGAGGSDRLHVSTGTRRLQEEGIKTNPHIFQAWAVWTYLQKLLKRKYTLKHFNSKKEKTFVIAPSILGLMCFIVYISHYCRYLSKLRQCHIIPHLTVVSEHNDPPSSKLSTFSTTLRVNVIFLVRSNIAFNKKCYFLLFAPQCKRRDQET